MPDSVPVRSFGSGDYPCRCCTTLTQVESDGQTCPACVEHSFGSSEVQNVRRTQDHLQMARRLVTGLAGALREQPAIRDAAVAAAVEAERRRHVCPGRDEINDAKAATASALRTREEAFVVLAGVHERHEPQDGKYCRCGKALAHCRDHLVVHGHALLERYMEADRG